MSTGQLTISDLQKRLPWDSSVYSEKFKVSALDQKDFDHALKHLSKALGMLSGITEEGDHAGATAAASFYPKSEVEKYLADIVICAVRAANTRPGGSVDLEQAVISRVHEKSKVLLTDKSAADVKESEEGRRAGIQEAIHAMCPLCTLAKSGGAIWPASQQGDGVDYWHQTTGTPKHIKCVANPIRRLR